jgi:hypothetical protein
VRHYFDGGLKFDSKLKKGALTRWSELRRELAPLEKQRPPAPAIAYTVTDAGPKPPATTIPGDRTGREIPPGILTVLESGDSDNVNPIASAHSSGRRSALAKWITNPEHPLTSRVMVNRMWQEVFGRGIVETPSNFGRLGAKPTHPELLDWMARWFVEHDWSIKELHRLMVTSSVYRQSSVRANSPEGAVRDRRNQLLWKMRVRRLDSEQIRDAALSVSGELDVAIGGPSVESGMPRRGIYTKVLRNDRDPLVEAFDGPDGFSSTPQRIMTTTPTQALLLFNGDWAVQRAAAFAKRIVNSSGSPRDRAELAFVVAFGRPPTASEMEGVLELTNGIESKEGAWTDVCHVLLNSNEFVYLD